MVLIFRLVGVGAHELVVDESVLGFDLVELVDDVVEVHMV
jgi:hypothetical protein